MIELYSDRTDGWLGRRSRVTHFVQACIEALAKLLPITYVTQLTKLHWCAINQHRL